MEANSTSKPRRGRRLLIVFGISVLAGIASFWLLPWLLMPEDLRRMQGEWAIVRVKTKASPNVKEGVSALLTITGSRFAISDEPDAYLIRLDPAESKFSIYSQKDNEAKFLGISMPASLWLLTASNRYVGNYELTQDTLTLCLTGNIENGELKANEEGRTIYLKRK